MRAPKEADNGWEKALTRFFAAHSLPLQWNYRTRRFTGIAGHLFARMNPSLESKMWCNMPRWVREYETDSANPDGKGVVIFATNRRYGDSIDESLVVMRLGTFIPMLKALTQYKERWVRDESPND